MDVNELDDATYGLFDFDLWLYDIGFGCQIGEDILPFDFVKSRIDDRMENIIEQLGLVAVEGYTTGSGNFRYDIAKQAPYKGTRVNTRKPFHFKNIENYLCFRWNCKILHGIEADDMLAVRQKQLGSKSIIISRDKDLRMVDGWHFGYECGKQGEFGPMLVHGIGEIDNKGKGWGIKFFWAQMLMGDSTDNILGCRNRGKVFAFKQLNHLDTEEEMALAVSKCYYDVYGTEWKSVMLEQGRLLWMHDTLNEDGTPVLWELPECIQGVEYAES
ncbi:putative phosphodiesterase [Vibrio phage 275E43-1]|nr:putative phosphodiesterase [Vibrio phage 275E43-1]